MSDKPFFEQVQEMYKQQGEVIDAMTGKQQPTDNWISVEDRLPDCADAPANVLIYVHGTVIAASYFAGIWYSPLGEQHPKHWMPLPEPPSNGADK